MRVHHVTFNSGNGEDFTEDAGWKDFFDKSTEDVNEDIDLVIFGLQEIHDSKFGLQETARRKLWREDRSKTQAKLQALAEKMQAKEKDIIEQIRNVPPDVIEAKEAAVEYLQTAIDDFTEERFVEMLKPVREWAKKGFDELGTTWMKNNYPNLDADGLQVSLLRRAYDLASSMNQLVAWMEAIKKREGPKISDPPGAPIEQRARLRRRETLVHCLETSMDGLLHDGDDESKMIQAFKTELEKRLRPPSDPDAAAAIDFGAIEVKAPAYRQTWDSGDICSVGGHYDTNLHVFVNPWSSWHIKTDTFASSECIANDGNDQGDTESHGCNINNGRVFQLFKNGHFVQKPECGKVVQILRLKATRTVDGVTDVITICVMNTHMSRKGGSEARLKYLKEAVQQTKAAECDAFSFGGDFNSRLDCESDTYDHTEHWEKDRIEQAKQPVSEYKGGNRPYARTNSMESVLDRFRINRTDGNPGDPEEYELTGKYRLADELTQYLERREVQCWEEKKGKWTLTAHSDNSIASETIIEGVEGEPGSHGQKPRKLPFNPTYKLKEVKSRKNSDRYDQTPFVHCVQGMNKCYYNKAGEGKNNPAWPDRVLAWGKEGAPEVTKYTSLDLTAAHHSDHNPVVAHIHFRPPLSRRTVSTGMKKSYSDSQLTLNVPQPQGASVNA